MSWNLYLKILLKDDASIAENLRKQLEKETGLSLKKDFCCIGQLDYTSKDGKKTRQFKLTTRAIEEPNMLFTHSHYK